MQILKVSSLPRCGTVTVTWLLVPTSTVAILFTSTEAGLKSPVMYKICLNYIFLMLL